RTPKTPALYQIFLDVRADLRRAAHVVLRERFAVQRIEDVLSRCADQGLIDPGRAAAQVELVADEAQQGSDYPQGPSGHPELTGDDHRRYGKTVPRTGRTPAPASTGNCRGSRSRDRSGGGTPKVA